MIHDEKKSGGGGGGGGGGVYCTTLASPPLRVLDFRLEMALERKEEEEEEQVGLQAGGGLAHHCRGCSAYRTY